MSCHLSPVPVACALLTPCLSWPGHPAVTATFVQIETKQLWYLACPENNRKVGEPTSGAHMCLHQGNPPSQELLLAMLFRVLVSELCLPCCLGSLCRKLGAVHMPGGEQRHLLQFCWQCCLAQLHMHHVMQVVGAEGGSYFCERVQCSFA